MKLELSVVYYAKTMDTVEGREGERWVSVDIQMLSGGGKTHVEGESVLSTPIMLGIYCIVTQ